MLDGLLKNLLCRFVRRGSIVFKTASGASFSCGDGTGIPVEVHLLSRSAELRILANPELALGEAFMDGEVIVARGSIADVLAVLMGQPAVLPWWAKLQWWTRILLRRLRQFNPPDRSRHNVPHHYDLDGRLYSLFLDSDRQYSCAYFETPDTSLDDAQLAKKRHLAAKLLVDRRHSVLDIGSGWGGLGLYLAEIVGAEVTGVTLSREQWQCSNARAVDKEMRRPPIFLLQDYRSVEGLSTASSRSACSSTSVSDSTTRSSGAAQSFSRTTAS
jgi:cyclopropane-fatty-acyl-phospholipid synthase